MADESAFTIEELTGDKRTVRLVGPSQPHSPATWGVQQSVHTHWYPGNANEACQQVLGPQDPPSDFEGSWHRTLLGKCPAVLISKGTETSIIYPMDLANLFDEIVRSGKALRVTWAALDGAGKSHGRIVREGRLQHFDSSYKRVDDCEWKMHFEWYGRGATMQKVAISRDSNALAGLAKARAAVNQVSLNKIASTAANSIESTLGKLEQIADMPEKLYQQFDKEMQRVSGDLDRIASLAAKGTSLPMQVAGSAFSAARGIVSTANKFVDKMTNLPLERVSNKRGSSDVLRSFNRFMRATDDARNAAIAAHELAVKLGGTQTAAKKYFKAQDQKAMIGVHVVKAGETVASIALKWYGNADHSDAICRANKIPLSTVTPSRPTLIIPSLGSVLK
jgi:hypothetical protein